MTVFILAIGSASAQTVQFDPAFGRNPLFQRKLDVAVMDRPQPQFDPVPIFNGGSFLFLETATAAEVTDNVFATRDNRVADVVVQANANARLVTDWRRHRVTAYATGTLRRYADTTTENSDLFGLGISGLLEVDERGGSLQAGGQIRRLQVSRTNTDSPFSSALPLFYNQVNVFLGGTYGGQELHVSAVGSYDVQRFDSNNDVSQIDEFRDRDILTLKATAAYALLSN